MNGDMPPGDPRFLGEVEAGAVHGRPTPVNLATAPGTGTAYSVARRPGSDRIPLAPVACVTGSGLRGVRQTATTKVATLLGQA
jgi:hypothetical protein